MPRSEKVLDSGHQAADHNLAGWSFDPVLIQGGTILGAGGTLNIVRIKVPVGSLITNIIMHVSTAGATLTASQCLAALFSGAGALLSSTADQSAAWVSTGLKTMPLSVAQLVPAGYVYVGFYANGTTMPTFARGANLSANTNNVGLSTPNTRFATTADTGLTTAMPSTLGAQANLTQAYWVALS